MLIKVIASLFFVSTLAYSATISRVKTFSDGSILTASDLNTEFNNVVNGINSINDANIIAGAGIQPSKISPLLAGSGLIRNGTTGELSVGVDGTTIEVTSNNLGVKDLSISTAKVIDASITYPKIAPSAISTIVQIAMPIGSILDFAGTTAPSGFLLCYGQTLNSTTNPEYAPLYAVIGNTYGGTDGTNFKLPDLRGRVLAGKDNMGGSAANRITNTSSVVGSTLGSAGGEQTHQLTIPEMPSHTHSYFYYSYTTAGNGTGATITPVNTSGVNATTGSSGSGTSHNNLQPTIIMNKVIKY